MSQTPSCSKQDWTRLRSLISSVSPSQTRLLDYESNLPSKLEEDSIYQSFLSQIQNKHLLIRIKKGEVDKLRKRIRNSQHRLTLLFEDECQQADKRMELERTNENTLSQIDIVSKENEFLRSSFTPLKNELIYRRRFVLKDLYEIYFIDNYLMRYFKRACSCTKFDVIAGLHLPSLYERADHSDSQICGAISHLVNLLNCLARITDTPLKNVLIFQGSNSSIFSRITNDRFDFHQTLTKGQKARFDLCQRLLCENVVQFRSDCGLPTQLDLPITSIREALLICIGKYLAPLQHKQSSENLYTCASLIPKPLAPANSLSLANFQINEETIEKDSQSDPIKIPISKSSILEVISTT